MSIIYWSQIHRYVFVVFARQATVVRFHENVAVLSDLCWLGQCDWGMRTMNTIFYLIVEPNHADTLPYVSVTSWSTKYRFIFKMLCGYFLVSSIDIHTSRLRIHWIQIREILIWHYFCAIIGTAIADQTIKRLTSTMTILIRISMLGIGALLGKDVLLLGWYVRLTPCE